MPYSTEDDPKAVLRSITSIEPRSAERETGRSLTAVRNGKYLWICSRHLLISNYNAFLNSLWLHC